VLDTVLQETTVLAGVKTSVVVLNRVLVGCIAAACKNFFLGHMTSLIHQISHHFENRNKSTPLIAHSELNLRKPITCDNP
jgi:hypothetical protein